MLSRLARVTRTTCQSCRTRDSRITRPGLLVVLPSGSWLARPTLLPALLFGVGTVLVPYVVMQPSFGLGIASSRTPHPMQARLKGLMAHTAFGVGLYVCAVGVSYVLAAAA
ncbi:MAG: DUF2938 family protein [Betaproteobacteria bacterium]